MGCLLAQDVEHKPGSEVELIEEKLVGIATAISGGVNASSGERRTLAVTMARRRDRD